MATNKYIELKSSDGSYDFQFRVVEGGYRPIEEKKQSMDTTLDGDPDIAQGGIYTRHEYTLRVREEEAGGSSYGTLSDLHALWALCNPNATPSDRLELTDHFGVTSTVVMMGDYVPEPFTTVLEGQHAWYYLKVVLQKVLSEGSGS